MLKWGIHYLFSFIRSLQFEIKNNFKDPGVAFFGGQLFNDFVDKADDIFNSMPPPTPSNFKEERSMKVQSMNVYNNCRSSCFGGDCLITMADGSQKLVKHLVKGDEVATPSGSARIVCVLETR
jgi:hypothetical protein